MPTLVQNPQSSARESQHYDHAEAKNLLMQVVKSLSRGMIVEKSPPCLEPQAGWMDRTEAVGQPVMTL